MLYKYEATTSEGEKKSGSIEAASLDLAVASLQRQNLIVIHIESAEKPSILSRGLGFVGGVKKRDVVFFTRQLATLFEAKVPVVDAFKLLSGEASRPAMRIILEDVLSGIQGGLSISQSLARHPDAFSSFFVNMVRAGEETGKLEEAFVNLANHLEYSYDVSTKVRNALLYPAFVLSTFAAVMILMLVFIMPKLNDILTESNAVIPWYTKVIIGSGDFLIKYGVFILIAAGFGVFFAIKYFRTSRGKFSLDRFRLDVPLFGNIFKKFYLARLTDNLYTMLSSGIPVVRAFETTADVVDNAVFSAILKESADLIKGGSSISDAFARYEDIPSLVSQMARVGEEAGELGTALKNLSGFYKKEAEAALASLVGMIEPIMIIVLGLGVGILVAGIMGPIYSITSSV
ncbi:MAG: Type II secretion system F domain protein [Parcubacteria group bacterium GW2011_GWB1_41_6]|nr:MAG: Type II secretion system F domain protein [Parcubacteria group bacterium GW2011_GWB1_41_6]KKS34138.1 MAG: Type II secretion system F domain protein [Parcubacteria group bacterium GW2011_GWC2_42_13]KKS70505.1 MAG: Type II secretion system F domain protein [Parcubacteria group bacterium GW2011_GWF2_42_7]